MKLIKFQKNKKNKRIVIGAFIGILFILVAFVFYQSFAFYKSEKSYDMLQGRVGTFVENNLELAMFLDGERVESVPASQDYVVNVLCDQGEAEWDYQNWIPIIKNITTKTKCSFNYETVNNINTLAKKIGVTGNNIDVILANIDQLVASKEGMTYLVKSPNLVTEMRQSSGYTEEVRLKLLDSKVISEDLKYNAGLPCYLFYKGDSLINLRFGLTRVNYSSEIFNANSRTRAIYWEPTDSLRLQIVDSTSEGQISTLQSIDLGNYDKYMIFFEHFTDKKDESLEGVVSMGLNQLSPVNKDNIVLDNKFTFNNYNTDFSSANSATLINDISSYTGKYYLKILLTHDEKTSFNTILCKFFRIALY